MYQGLSILYDWSLSICQSGWAHWGSEQGSWQCFSDVTNQGKAAKWQTPHNPPESLLTGYKWRTEETVKGLNPGVISKVGCVTVMRLHRLSASAKQCQNRWSRSPPVYRDLSMHHDWPLKKSHCRFANQIERKFESVRGPGWGYQCCFADVTNRVKLRLRCRPSRLETGRKVTVGLNRSKWQKPYSFHVICFQPDF